MLSSHLYLGLPCDLLVRGFQLHIFLTVLVSGILIYEYMITKYGKVPNTTQNYANTHEIFVLLGCYAAQTDLPVSLRYSTSKRWESLAQHGVTCQNSHYVRPLSIAQDMRNYDRTTANCLQTWPSANRCPSALQPRLNLLLLTASTVLL
jgi:hypothetical protein